MRRLSDDLKFEYLLDSAVLLEVGGRKILVDGLPGDGNAFDRLSPELEEAIMAGQGDFAGLNGLFFTHCHDDHFDSGKLATYLERNPGSFVVVPGDAGEDPHIFVPAGEKGELRHGPDTAGPDFEYMKTEHLTYDCPEHYAYNFLSGDTNVIVTGDMDLVKPGMLRGFTMREHSFIFVNNVLLWHKRWCDMIEAMGFEKVFIYHVPSAENDSEGYRERAAELWPVNGEGRPGWEVLNL